MAQQNFTINLDDATYQAALIRAQREGKSVDQALAELLATYAKTETTVTSYTVQRGDTLSKIARAVYGDPYKYPLIQQANNLSDPGKIWVGQVLVIPLLADTTPPPAAIIYTDPSRAACSSVVTSASTHSFSCASTPCPGSTTGSRSIASAITCPAPNFGRLCPGHAQRPPA